MAFTSYKVRNVTTVQSLTPATFPATVIGLSVANTGASEATISAYVSGNSVDTYIVKNAKIPVGSSLILIGAPQKLVLIDNGAGTDDVVKIVSDIAVDAIMSTLE